MIISSVPEGCGVLELNDLWLAQVDGHQVVLQVLLNGGQRDEERLYVPDTHTQTECAADHEAGRILAW